MRLDRLSAAIRPRSNWEAMDLGIALLRRDAAAVYGAWLAVTGPIALMLLLVALWTDSVVPTVLFWWLKPVFDRVVLHVLSQSLFGARPGVGATLTAVPRLFRGWLFSALVLRRLDLARAFNLPVWQLEGLKGGAARRRLGVLNAKARGSAIGGAIVCMHLAVAIQVALLGLAFAFIPPEWVNYQDVWSWFFVESTPATGAVVFLVYYVAETVIEPLFVASGFGLYLGRRTQLEAWDLELAFRKLALKLAPAVAALLVCVGLLPLPGLAQDDAALPSQESWEAAVEAAPDYWQQRVAAGRPAEPEEWIDAARSINADSIFGQREESWQLKPRAEPEEPADESPSWVGWLGTMGDALAILLEMLLWLGAAALAFLAGRYLWSRRGALQPRVEGQLPEVFRLAVDDEQTQSLPADIAAAASSALDRGDTVRAISLLYRGSLERFQNQGLVLPAGATEAECLRNAAAVAEARQIDLFRRIVGYWQATAYADRALEANAIREIVRSWRPAFGASS